LPILDIRPSLDGPQRPVSHTRGELARSLWKFKPDPAGHLLCTLRRMGLMSGIPDCRMKVQGR
jgi:hypothetical protein